MTIRTHLLTAAIAATLAAGCATHSGTTAPEPSSATSPDEARPGTTPRDTHESLDGTLWMQTSAEFRVLTSTAYERAEETLDRALADPRWTAALEQETSDDLARLPPAVIMDLDETVLDNSQLQAQLVLDRTDYLPATWTAWVEQASAPAIPGAIDFIKVARSKGVRVVFVTNRTAPEEARTIENLDRLLGAATPSGDVHCSGENGWTSDKTARRRFVAERYRVLLVIGDDLNDFVSVRDAETLADRHALARKNEALWRDRWVLIPNPLYGSWERILTPGVEDDADILREKRRVLRGFRN